LCKNHPLDDLHGRSLFVDLNRVEQIGPGFFCPMHPCKGYEPVA
jgi:hypothetical protein